MTASELLGGLQGSVTTHSTGWAAGSHHLLTLVRHICDFHLMLQTSSGLEGQRLPSQGAGLKHPKTSI